VTKSPAAVELLQGSGRIVMVTRLPFGTGIHHVVGFDSVADQLGQTVEFAANAMSFGMGVGSQLRSR
jgi:hypothetical protein